MCGGVEVERVGDEAFAVLLEQIFDHRMAAAENEEFAGIGKFRPDVAARGG